MVQPLFMKRPSAVKKESSLVIGDIDIESFMLEAIVTLEEEMYNINREHLMSIHIGSKDGNMEILTEGAGDFLKSAAMFFSKLVRHFTQVMNNALMYVRAHLGEFDKFIKKYADQISKANPDFSIQGYDYTFSNIIPQLNKLQAIVQDYNRDIGQVPKMEMEELYDERDKYTSEDYFDKIRGEVMHSDPIDRNGFSDNVKSSYRDGRETKDDIHINKAKLEEMVSGYNDLKTHLKDAYKQKDVTILLLDNIRTFFERGVTVHYDSEAGRKVAYAHQLSVRDDGHTLKKEGHYEETSTPSTLKKYNVYFAYKLKLAKEIGFISVTAVTEKVTALKEAMAQYEKVIRRSVLLEPEKESGDK